MSDNDFQQVSFANSIATTKGGKHVDDVTELIVKKLLVTFQFKNFRSKCTLSDKFITAVTKCGIIEALLPWAKFKAQDQLEKKSGGKKKMKSGGKKKKLKRLYLGVI